MLDGQNDFIIADTTAGVDSVGTSMFYASDLNIFVVEPTKRSIAVYNDFINITKDQDVNTYVVCNKISDDSDLEYMYNHIDKSKIIATFRNSENVKKYEQDESKFFEYFVKENIDSFNSIYDFAINISRDWNKYYDKVVELYKNKSYKRYNNLYNKDMLKYIDPEFNYIDVINRKEGI
ncbi:hypothetical protein D3C73_1169970 [compost metagenome]